MTFADVQKLVLEGYNCPKCNTRDWVIGLPMRECDENGNTLKYRTLLCNHCQYALRITLSTDNIEVIE